MPRQIHILSDRVVKYAGAGTHNDGDGLTLRVGTNGKRSWVLRYTWDGKPANLGLGSYPGVGLKEARALAAERRAEAAEGSKPSGGRLLAPVKLSTPAMPTFREITEEVIELRRPTWKSARHGTQWTQSLTNHAFPAIGDMPIDKIDSADVLGMLAKIWNETPVTASRVKQRAQVIFDYAIAKGLRKDNPVLVVDRALPTPNKAKVHHPALPYAEAPTAVKAIRESTCKSSTRLALEFLILTAGRAGEVKGATWSEIDLDARTWTIPAARMKKGMEHRVPMSDRCMAILEEVKELGKGNGLVFPNKKGKALNNQAFALLLEKQEIAAVPHGFRSTFRDWVIEQTATPWAVGETALAHRLGNSTESAYARTDLFERRRVLMQDWADFVGGV